MLEAREEGEKTQRTIELLHQMEIQERDEALTAAYARIAELEAQLKNTPVT